MSERTRTVDADSYEAGHADGRAAGEAERERLRGDNAALLDAAKVAQGTIGWVTDASKERRVKEALQKAIDGAEKSGR